MTAVHLVLFGHLERYARNACLRARSARSGDARKCSSGQRLHWRKAGIHLAPEVAGPGLQLVGHHHCVQLLDGLDPGRVLELTADDHQPLAFLDLATGALDFVEQLLQQLIECSRGRREAALITSRVSAPVIGDAPVSEARRASASAPARGCRPRWISQVPVDDPGPAELGYPVSPVLKIRPVHLDSVLGLLKRR